MYRNILTVVGITILFLGLAIQPSLATVQPESIDVEYFDVTTEFIGLGKEYTTKLTKQEIERLDTLFDSIGDSLNKSVSIEKIVDIFRKALSELDSFGLLGDIKIDEAEKLVTNYYQNPRFIKVLNKLKNRKNSPLGEDEDRYCLVAGKATNLLFINSILNNLFLSLFYFIFYLIDYQNFGENWQDVQLIFALIMEIVYNFIVILPSILIPICLGRAISFGYPYGSLVRGNITTYGLNGIKYWNGQLEGKIVWSNWDDIGVMGFTGLKIGGLNIPNHYFIGYANHVHIEDS